MTVGSYVLARFADPEKLLPAMQTVQSSTSVERWNAVDGHIHLVMKLSSPAVAIPDPLKRLEGVDQMMAYDILHDDERSKQLDSAMAHAYVFLEVEPSKLDTVRTSLAAIPEVVFCTTTRGGCDLIAVVTGGNFDAVDSVINEDIRMLDGLLRLKQAYILELTKL